jgi:methionyl-tRNA formyltransferase
VDRPSLDAVSAASYRDGRRPQGAELVVVAVMEAARNLAAMMSQSKDSMKTVLLLGMGPTAGNALESLAERFRVVGLIRDVEPGCEAKDEVIQRADLLGVPVITDISMESVERAVIEFNPDCTVVSSYYRILSPRILARGRFVNVHYAPIPKYRGRAVVNWAIINGESEWAITIHAIAPALDAGNVLHQKHVPIGPDDTVGDL